MPRTVSPTEKLIKRIEREFPKKKMIGDIRINDQEFELLMSYFRKKYNYMRTSGNHQIIDPIFCVALVQIGIRFYDGAYWSHVKKILQSPKFNINHQVWIGSVFVETLKMYNKIQLGDRERVNSILMHGFVSDKFADKFFDFLYAFYKIDLERDISRMDRETINSLATVVQKNDNKGRTYFLVEQTADAFRENSRGAKLRVRRYLKLIDKAFWGEDLPETSTNRIMSYFLHWKNTSQEFLNEKRINDGSLKKGKRSYASPYLKYNPKNDIFMVVIPPQIIRSEDFNNLYWSIDVDGENKKFEINQYQCVIGYKTEELSYIISEKSIFSTYYFSLMNEETKIRSFRIISEPIRLFDAEGYFVGTNSVQQGFLYAFTEKNFIPKSEALIEMDTIKGLLRMSFELVKGDIIRLPDGKPISVGGKVQEGLLPRGCVKGVVAEYQGERIHVYMNSPIIIIKTREKRIPGTAIYINKKVYHFIKEQKLANGISEFDLYDRSGEKGYLINLQKFGVKKDGIYEVCIDVPNEHSQRNWKFSLIQNLNYEFEDAPYIFNNRGTLSLPISLKCIPEKKDVTEEIQERKRYNFDINAEEDYLYFKFGKIRLGFEIPAFSYQFEGEDWLIGKHIDVWHSDFNPKLKIKYSADKVRIFLNDTGSDHSDDHSDTFMKNKKKNIFECDLNRFKSWFGREVIQRKLYIEVPEKEKPISFLKVITKSVLRDSILQADFNNNLLIGIFDIVGYSNYYVDIFYRNECVYDKILLTDGYMEVQSELKSGQYEVIVYEVDEDDSGFGDDVYYEIGRKTVDLLNVEDLNGRSIYISMIKPAEESVFYLSLKYKYSVVNLRKKNIKDKHNYRGKMIVQDYKEKCIATFLVNVEFYDLNQLGLTHITFVDDEDYELEFLYDDSKKMIVKQEDPRLSKSQAYRRYKNVLYQEDYVFNVRFFNPSKKILEVEVNDEKYNNINVNLQHQRTVSTFRWK